MYVTGNQKHKSVQYNEESKTLKVLLFLLENGNRHF